MRLVGDTRQWVSTGNRGVINRSLWRPMVLGSLGLTLVSCYGYVVFASGNHRKAVSMYPSQEVAVAVEANYMMDRLDAAFASSTPWEDQEAKDKWIASLKKLADSRELLAIKFGPVEIPQDETVETATRVAIPLPSATLRTRATGAVWDIHRVPDANNGAWAVFEKRETSGGSEWYSVDFSPGRTGLKEWLRLPRKKVADSPTIILKKAVVVQILDANEAVADQRILYFDK